MVERRTLWLMIPRPIRTLPADLSLVVVLAIATPVATLAPVLRETPVWIPLVPVFVLFLPGYALVAALFPAASDTSHGTAVDGTTESTTAVGETTPTGTGDDQVDSSRRIGVTAGVDRPRIDGIERVALSFALSVAIAPLIGLGLSVTPWGIELEPILVTMTLFSFLAVIVAAVRRSRLPTDDQFRVPSRAWSGGIYRAFFEPDSRTDALLNVFLALAVVFAFAAVGFAAVAPQQGERFSAIYLLGEDSDGELGTGNFTTELTRGEPVELVVGVDNHEHERTSYEVVVLEQELAFETGEEPGPEGAPIGNQSTVTDATVTDQRELDRFNTTLSHDETWHHPHTVEPTVTGENVRLVWLLFPDDTVPSEPSMADAEYSVFRWVDVDEPTDE
ncbi:putative membrane protein [Halovivax ruber XH-70]|uniref:Putative membrane protein n=1 Tax=Halovivax ruber (strain DSM 18193 / JCM 13892 / XH-70) TaxID=797302 RepID=L0I868_HALRX|nr:DUF1616 domain-containing protein [Halovivax ruber]AGB14879.1 putative membrane protein [Halovivax ruber XH-70]